MVWPPAAEAALLTDLYELTMMQAYFREGRHEPASFELFVRRLPEERPYLLAAGLDTALAYLEELRFTDEGLDYLASLGQFDDAFLRHLADFRFTGSVRAIPEGTPVFADEPILEVTAPLPQAQLAETFLLNQVHFQTLMASKAARVVAAAGDRPVVDFGARRTHGADAAVKAARAFHIAGVAATSNVLAGHTYGLPVAGTMAHSYIEAHADERAAFDAFATSYPATILLVDTYATLEGVRRVVDLAGAWGEAFRVRGIRLDSGDLGALSHQARRILDDAGLDGVEIFASGSLDEFAIADLLASGAPIDGFGVGTHMGVSEDAPFLDSAYKLVEYAGAGRMKLASSKLTRPGRKQVFRHWANAGMMAGDTIARMDEDPGGTPLLTPVMRDGERTDTDAADLAAARERAADYRARLPHSLTRFSDAGEPYPVAPSERLAADTEALRRAVAQREGLSPSPPSPGEPSA